MKNKVIICIAIIIAIIVLTIISRNLNKEILVDGIDTSSALGLETFIEKIYEGNEDNMPMVQSMQIDVNDEDMVKTYTGLSSNENIEYAVVSEPLMSSQAYSLVMLKVSENSNIEEMKQEIFDNIDTRKWICVEAESLYATDYDDTIIFVMSSSELTNTMVTSIKDILGDAIGNELEETRSTTLDDNLEDELGEPVAQL